jgi:hypothetical protein
MSSVLSPLPPRPRVDDHHLLRVASRLTDRDRVLIRLLHEHRVFTSAQVHDIGFDSYRRAQERLGGALRRARRSAASVVIRPGHFRSNKPPPVTTRGFGWSPAAWWGCWAGQTSRHARQQSKTDQQISFRNR